MDHTRMSRIGDSKSFQSCFLYKRWYIGILENKLYNHLLSLACLTKLLNVNHGNGFLFLATQISWLIKMQMGHTWSSKYMFFFSFFLVKITKWWGIHNLAGITKYGDPLYYGCFDNYHISRTHYLCLLPRQTNHLPVSFSSLNQQRGNSPFLEEMIVVYEWWVLLQKFCTFSFHGSIAWLILYEFLTSF